MPDADGTEFSTPIPLRENASAVERPNPWSRQEAANVALTRLRFVQALLADREPASRVGLVAVLEAVIQDLQDALWGDLQACERVRDAVPLGPWGDHVRAFLWPPATHDHDQHQELDSLRADRESWDR